MALTILSTGQNRTATTGHDRGGAMFLDLMRKLQTQYTAVGSGWRIQAQGDGASAVSTVVGADIFTSNGGLGYATSGLWDANTANSFSNADAHFRMGEYVAGVATGRQFTVKRSSTGAINFDRNFNIAFSWTGFTGAVTATQPATGGTYQPICGTDITAAQAGTSLWGTLSTQPVMAATNTITWHIWVCDEASGTSGDVCPFTLCAYDSTNSDLAFMMFYEALVDAPTDTHPCVIACGDWVRLGGEVTGATPDIFNAASQPMWGRDSGGTIRRCGIMRATTPDNGSRPGAVTAIAAGFDSKYPVMPAFIWADDPLGSTLPQFKGVLETIEWHFPASSTYLWPTTFHASVADAVEPARVSKGHLLFPWTVGGANPTWSANANRTDIRRILASAPVPDETAPVIGSFSPPPGAIAYNQAISVPITDNQDELEEFSATVLYADRPAEFVWDGANLSDSYDTGSGSAVIANGVTWTTARDVGWPAAFTLRVRARDADGNTAEATASYTITGDNPASDDTTAPSIVNILPAPGSAIADDRVIQFEVVDDRGLAYFAVFARYLDKREYDVVWDGSDFAPKYLGSEVTAIDDGWRFEVTRDLATIGGWAAQGRVQFKVVPVDTSGNVGDD